jgi:hypothetical protein
MLDTEMPVFLTDLKELSSCYKGTIYNEFFAGAYWKILKPYSLEAIHRACLDLLGNEVRKPLMPSPADIKAVARKFEPPKKSARVVGDEERWRRRYDVWQRGRFSDDALAMVFTMSDEELGVGQEGDDTYIRCQEPGCETRIPWPVDDGVMHCRPHQVQTGKTVTPHEKRQMIAGLTPRARAYLRPILTTLMAEMPVTPEEQAFHETPWSDLPPKMAAYLATLDEATAARIVENFHTRGDQLGMGRGIRERHVTHNGDHS